MAEENILEQGLDAKAIKEERKRLKAEQKAQRKEAKMRARELADQEAELDQEGSNIPIFLTTIAIVGIWLLIGCWRFWKWGFDSNFKRRAGDKSDSSK